jgi:hypothetical protein
MEIYVKNKKRQKILHIPKIITNFAENFHK